MAMDYDTQVGVEIDAEFQQAINATKRMIEETQQLCESLKGMTAGMNAVHNLTKSMKTLSDINFSSIDNQIDSMVSALSRLSQELSKLNLSGLTGVADDLRVLMNSASGFNLSWIKQLQQLPKIMESIKASDSKELGKVFSTLATQIQPFLNNIEKSRSQIKSLANTGKEFSKFNSDIEKAKNKVKELGNTGDKTKSKLKQMFTVGRLIYFYNMSKQLFGGIGNIIGKAIDFGEVENLFSVAMRDMRGEALKFQNQLSEAFGLALPDMMKAQGIFKNMLSSLKGLNSETSTMLSQTLTKMSVDFASLYNTSIESAITKLEAALSRQVRPIRSVSGYDITQNVLQATAENIGITDRAIAQMGEMEKRLLIIITLQDQMRASGAMGDFARTIEMPAQQLKILQQQLAETGRWIGAVFMGTVGKVLPYINGFVMAIKEVIKALALLVGYQIPDSSGVTNILDQMAGSAGDYNDSIESANKELDKTKKKIKEITDASLPFDELNTIPKDTSSSDTGSTGGGSPSLPSGYIDPRILGALSDYDNLMGSVSMKAKAIRDRIMEWLGFTKTIDGLTGDVVWRLKDGYTNLEKIRDMVMATAIAFASWKIANSIMKFLLLGTSGFPLFSGIKNMVLDFMKLNGITTGFNAIFGKVLVTAFGIAGTIAAMGLRFYDLLVNNENFRRGLGVVGDVLDWIGSLIGSVFGGISDIISDLSSAMGLTSEQGRGVAMSLGAIALLFTPAAPFALAYLTFDAITRSIEVLGKAFAPAIEQINVLDGACAQTKTNLEPMLDTMDEMDKNLKQMDWGDLVPNAETVEHATSTVNKYCNDLVTHTENSRKRATDTLNAMFAENAQSTQEGVQFTMEEQQKMLDHTNSTYDNIETTVREKQAEINTIYQTASAENRALSDEEVNKIAENQKWLKEKTVEVISASAEEQNTILNNMKVNATALSLEQASEVIKNSAETRNKTRTEAENRYQEQIALAKKLRQDGSAESIALADKITKEAERQKREACTKADEMHQAVVNEFKEQNPEIARYLDEGSGEIKTKMDVWLENFNSWCSETGKSIESWWKNDICPWFTVEKWQELGENMKQGILSKFDEFVNWWDNLGFVVWWREKVEPWFSFQKWCDLANGLKDGLIQGIKNAVNGGIGLFNSFIDWVNEKMKISWDGWEIAGHKIISGGEIQLFTIPHIPTFAQGGFLNGLTPGQLFIMNEPNNPEFLTNIGGKTGVANQGQMTIALKETMKQGLLEAFAMMPQNQYDPVIEVHNTNVIDGEQLSESVNKAERRKGFKFVKGGGNL